MTRDVITRYQLNIKCVDDDMFTVTVPANEVCYSPCVFISDGTSRACIYDSRIDRYMFTPYRAMLSETLYDICDYLNS